MNIIFDIENIDAIKNNNVLLELDTFYFDKLNKTATAYCVIDNIKITDLAELEQHQTIHAELIESYKQKKFKLCQDLLKQLVGAFGGEVDSFYQELHKRTDDLKSKISTEDWNPIIVRKD
jgi:hypothetical protein